MIVRTKKRRGALVADHLLLKKNKNLMKKLRDWNLKTYLLIGIKINIEILLKEKSISIIRNFMNRFIKNYYKLELIKNKKLNINRKTLEKTPFNNLKY